MAEIADAERAIEVMEASLEHIGAVVDSDDLDAEAVVSGDTEEFSDEELLLSVITELESSEHGANQEQVLAAGRKNGLSKTEAQQALKNLKQRGKAYEPKEGELRST
jgi:replicative DNA helicase Mcm